MLQCCPFFELEKCAFNLKLAEIDKDFNGDQITLLVVGIPTKKQPKKEPKRYIFMVYLLQVLVAIVEKKLAI